MCENEPSVEQVLIVLIFLVSVFFVHPSVFNYELVPTGTVPNTLKCPVLEAADTWLELTSLGQT